MGNSAARDTKKLGYAQKVDTSLAMRAVGFSYQDIADKHWNGNRSAAWKAIQKAIERLPVENAEQVRAQELELLDKLVRGSAKAALAGDAKAAGTVLRCMERRAKYLGLDEAQKIEANGTGFAQIIIDPRTLGGAAPAE